MIVNVNTSTVTATVSTVERPQPALAINEQTTISQTSEKLAPIVEPTQMVHLLLFMYLHSQDH